MSAHIIAQGALIMKSKIVWYLRQLLPLTYRSHYSENGQQYFCVWNMWFGRCFNVETIAVA